MRNNLHGKSRQCQTVSSIFFTPNKFAIITLLRRLFASKNNNSLFKHQHKVNYTKPLYYGIRLRGLAGLELPKIALGGR